VLILDLITKPERHWSH